MTEKPFETLDSRVVYKNRWTLLREDIIRRPDGSEGIYGVIERNDFALIVPIHDDGRFQMVNQYRYPVDGRFWEFPQGAWEDKPDADPAELAHGELEEETGFRAASMEKIGFLYENCALSNQGGHCFVARGLRPGAQRLEVEEQDMTTAAFTRAEIDAMIRAGDIRDASTMAALTMLALAEQGGGP